MSKMKNIGRRTLAWMLTVMMCMSMVNSTVFASDGVKEQEKAQIYNFGGETSKDGVKVSKTIAATGDENYFDITLKVTTPKSIDQIVKDQSVAVVLVMDLSNTMNAIIGGGTQQRREATLAATNQFLQSFANMSKGSNATRQVGVVGFNTSGHKLSGLATVKTSAQATSVYNTVVTEEQKVFGTKAGSDAAKSSADAYKSSHNRFTNMEAGLAYAYDMLNSTNCQYKYVIFLTDGFPTTYLKTGTTNYEGYDPYCTSGTPGNDGVFYNAKDYNITTREDYNRYTIYGTSYSDTAAKKAQDKAESLKSKGVTIYSVGVDVKGQTVKQYANDSRMFSVIETRNQAGAGATQFVIGYDKTTDFTNWLKNKIGSGYYYDSNDGSLTAHFNDILSRIETNVKTEVEASWVAADPIPFETDCVDFKYFYARDGKTAVTGNLTGSKKLNGENTASYSDHTISWNLPQSGYTNSDGTQYELKYRVRLTNEQVGFYVDKYYKTNGTTVLNYKINKQTGDKTEITPGDVEFKIPEVHGYLGNLSFNKVAQGSEKALGGAVFTLTHDASCCGVNVSAKTVTSVEADGGKVSFTGIPSGHKYTLKETTPPSGYELSDETWTVNVAYGNTTVQTGTKGTVIDAEAGNSKVANTIDPKSVDITITKNWQGDFAGLRPDFGDMAVVLHGTDGNDYNVTGWKEVGGENNKWQATIAVPKFDVNTSELISYTVEETTVPKGYIIVEGQGATVDPTTGLASISNKLSDTVEVSVRKDWVAPENVTHDGVEVTLYGNGEVVVGSKVLDATNDWSWTFDELPQYGKNGEVIEYTVAEKKVDGYNFAYSKDADGTLVVTNTIKQDYVNISGSKQWKGVVPETAQEVTLTGKISTGETVYTETVTMTGENTAFAFVGVPKYDVARVSDDGFAAKGTFTAQGTGEVIVYTVSDEVAHFVTKDATVSADNTVTLVNTRDDIDDKIDITATKIWKDETNANNTRTGNEVFVLQQLVGEEWVDVEGVEPENISGRYTYEVELPAEEPEEGEEPAEPETETVTGWNNQKEVKFEGLRKFDAETGMPIQYRVVERNLNDKGIYTVSGDGTVKANNAVTITNTLDGDVTSVTVYKNWKDNFTGREVEPVRPGATVTLTGTANGAVVVTETHVFDGSEDAQSFMFEELPVYHQGYKIVYSAAETVVPEGYNSSKGSDGFTFTNTVKQEVTDISVQKIWNGTLAAEYRPEIEIKLIRADGTAEQTVDTITGVDLDGNFTKTWNNQDVYNIETGHKWVYRVEETMTGANAEGGRYTTTYPETDSAYTFEIVNTFNEGETSVSGAKFWYTPNNVRPTNEQIEAVVITVRSTNATTLVERTTGIRYAAGTYTYEFTGLPKFDAVTGVELEYVVDETTVPDGFTKTLAADGRTFYNRSDELDDTVVVRASKTWVGPVEMRPEDGINVIVTGSNGTETVMNLNENNGWSDSMTMPKYAADHNEIIYTISEEGAENGVVVINGLEYNVTIESSELAPLSFAINNTLRNQETVAIHGEKVWNALADLELPEEFDLPEITVRLYIDGNASETFATLNNENGWEFDFGEFPKYALADNGVVEAADGHTIRYEVREAGVEGESVIFTQHGRDYVFDVKHGTGEDGNFDVVNSYRDTQRYYFELETWYVTHYNSGRADVVLGPIQRVEVTEGMKDELITAGLDGSRFPAGQWTTHNGYRYIFDADNEGNVLNVKLEKSGEVYKMVLWYERTVRNTTPRDPDPVTPPPEDPTPDDPGVEIPDPDVPLTNIDIPDEDVPLAEIPEMDIPLAEVPLTGDEFINHYLYMAMASAMGLVGLKLLGKKDEEEA